MSESHHFHTIDSKDRKVVRDLAKRLSELAARPGEEEKRNLWRRHNGLKETRPLVLCYLGDALREVITPDQLQCAGELARQWEGMLRALIFCGEALDSDWVTEANFDVPYMHTQPDWGMHEKRIGGENGGSYRWEAPLKDYKDMDKLVYPEIRVDHAKTLELSNLAKETLGDILNVRVKGWWWWTLGMTMTFVNLRGLEQMMFDVYDYPDEFHRLMAFLRDGHMHMLDFLEKNGLLSLNSDGSVGSGGLGYTNELPRENFSAEKVGTMDMWGFAESQETTQISPEMFEAFVFQYQLPILERFGLNCYGCCEPLNKRWGMIKKIPRLRRVSVSPWADLGDMAEKLGDRYVYSMKPTPADLACPQIDEEYIRKNLRKALQTTRDCRVEIIMKDTQTICGNPQNAIRWCRIAREEAEHL